MRGWLLLNVLKNYFAFVISECGLHMVSEVLAECLKSVLLTSALQKKRTLIIE